MTRALSPTTSGLYLITGWHSLNDLPDYPFPFMWYPGLLCSLCGYADSYYRGVPLVCPFPILGTGPRLFFASIHTSPGLKVPHLPPRSRSNTYFRPTDFLFLPSFPLGGIPSCAHTHVCDSPLTVLWYRDSFLSPVQS